MFIKWMKIQQFHNMYKSLKTRQKFLKENSKHVRLPIVTYRGKIKLDGTNAGIRIKGKDILPQSRTKVLGIGDDNYGFAQWVEDNRDWIKGLGEHRDFIIFGEWCGKGIQKRTAVSRVNKMFCVFAVMIVSDEITTFCDPRSIEARVDPHLNDGVHVLPWLTDEITVDLEDESSVKEFVDRVNGLVDEVENCDPWVSSTFGVDGLGEGIVFYPTKVIHWMGGDWYEELTFKAKGEKHQEVRQPKPVVTDPEVMGSIEEFVDRFVTEQRLEHAVEEACKGTYEMRMTGPFLKWICQDVKDESIQEIEELGLEWKHLQKAVSSRARDWWKRKCESLP